MHPEESKVMVGERVGSYNELMEPDRMEVGA